MAFGVARRRRAVRRASNDPLFVQVFSKRGGQLRELPFEPAFCPFTLIEIQEPMEKQDEEPELPNEVILPVLRCLYKRTAQMCEIANTHLNKVASNPRTIGVAVAIGVAPGAGEIPLLEMPLTDSQVEIDIHDLAEATKPTLTMEAAVAQLLEFTSKIPSLKQRKQSKVTKQADSTNDQFLSALEHSDASLGAPVVV